MVKVSLIIGTRPEIIKTSPIIRELEKQNIHFFVVHTVQHYSYTMDKIFFDELELKAPKYRLNTGSASHAKQTAKMMIDIERIIKKEKPDIVIVQGDTNSTLAGALVSAKMQIPVAHVESGIRSLDRRMPEEINRLMITQCSELHFAPTENAMINLLYSGIPRERIFVVGNTIIDACLQNIKIAKKIFSMNLGNFALMTIHRPENVDNEDNFKSIISGVSKLDIDVVYPVHPRSEKMIKKFGIKTGRIKTVEPMGYFEFLYHLNKAKFVITDSGGIIEEAIALNVPSICVRDSTDRPEAVDAGGCVISGPNSSLIKKYGNRLINDRKFYRRMKNAINPYGDGKAGKRIVKIIKNKYEKGELGVSYIKSEGFNIPRFQIRKNNVDKFLVFESIPGGKISSGKENVKVFGPVEKKLKKI